MTTDELIERLRSKKPINLETLSILLEEAADCIEGLEDRAAEKQEHLENLQKVNEDLKERIAIMTEHGLWIPVEERLPENAQRKGAFCPRYRVYTKWGETVGWYNPDKGYWYFLLWYLDGEGIDFERGDNPKVAHEICGAKVVTHWMPLSAPPKEGEAE